MRLSSSQAEQGVSAFYSSQTPFAQVPVQLEFSIAMSTGFSGSRGRQRLSVGVKGSVSSSGIYLTGIGFAVLSKRPTRSSTVPRSKTSKSPSTTLSKRARLTSWAQRYLLRRRLKPDPQSSSSSAATKQSTTPHSTEQQSSAEKKSFSGPTKSTSTPVSPWFVLPTSGLVVEMSLKYGTQNLPRNTPFQ